MRPLFFAILATLVLPLAACLQFKQDVTAKNSSGMSAAANAGPAWGPATVKLEWHPATRVRPDGKRWVLDARVRLVDGLNDYTKGSGVWHFELHTIGGLAQGRFDLLQRWDAQVWDFAEHKAHFDPATRAYRFILEMDAPPPQGKPLHVLAVFTPDGGQRMAVEMEL